jgi:hypothetical protein
MYLYLTNNWQAAADHVKCDEIYGLYAFKLTDEKQCPSTNREEFKWNPLKAISLYTNNNSMKENGRKQA